MTNRNADAPQGEGGNDAVPPASQPQALAQPQSQTQGNNDNLVSRGNNKVYKSGPLFLSSKGIGWTSWKKRWFVLTRTSLVFHRSDPNAVAQKGQEVNLTLGGIDLNSSGSVVVKEDKKLLTVLFPDGRDGRDGRAFTLKAETSEDLFEWKAALEEALANAPSAALAMGQNGLFRNEQNNATDASAEQAKDRQPVKSLVIGRPILLALEDIDGTPSFLEKALKFVEDHGVKVEGILRQAADVEDVERRIREYEQGKSEFSPDEDAHVIADCVKYILRELPSSPVPASCCNALLEAYRSERSLRVNAMRVAICETFPEPNRRLLQRILIMMQSVASHKTVNRMSVSAVAACMAPLLLRPLLAGDCELGRGFDMGGDNSLQLMQAAAAANHAQAICITLLEEYNSLFGEGSASPEPYSDTEESGSETEELTDDDETYEDDEDDYTTEGSDADISKESECSNSGSDSPEVEDNYEPNKRTSPRPPKTSKSLEISNPSKDANEVHARGSGSGLLVPDPDEASIIEKSSKISAPLRSVRRATAWGRTPGRKNLSMESIDISFEDEAEIERLEATKTDLQNRVANEAKSNAILQSNLEERKNALRERRLALERDVARLQEQLQKERELRAALEAGLRTSQGELVASSIIDDKMKAEIEEIAQAELEVLSLKQKADDLGVQLNHQREQNSRLQIDMSNNLHQSPNDNAKWKDKQKNVDTTSTQHTREKSSRNKYDNRLDKQASDKAKKQGSSSSTDDNLQNQQTPSGDLGATKPASSSSRKSSSRPEVTFSFS
ncbi:OLC1v1017249C3 [Oldenlandia corymbosa var. corymbosa]|uniref:OLC1v1017249C3 n=1 Tax=Oldenlandia corymbosa var. corymbosa TaxID=529605 RepID=A0AAV1E902_OLDCO|nr:OLC1v1017249C3 [Oldenlandia corymbosa var. corymbosa]